MQEVAINARQKDEKPLSMLIYFGDCMNWSISPKTLFKLISKLCESLHDIKTINQEISDGGNSEKSTEPSLQSPICGIVDDAISSATSDLLAHEPASDYSSLDLNTPLLVDQDQRVAGNTLAEQRSLINDTLVNAELSPDEDVIDGDMIVVEGSTHPPSSLRFCSSYLQQAG